MKKVLVFLVLVMVSVMAYGEINTSWNTVGEPHGNLKFNVNVGDSENPDYYPLQVKLDMPVKTADGKGKGQVTIIKNVGTNQPEPFDFSTKQGLKDVHAALPGWAKRAFKEAVIAAINFNSSE